MILAEKIMCLRKQRGLSQEELAEFLDVSRQSVSKWESASSIPDIQKIIKMSEIFQVTTDYLLKDELEEDTYKGNQSNSFDFAMEEGIRKVGLEEATEYLDAVREKAGKIAIAISLFIISPTLLIFTEEITSFGFFKMSYLKSTAIGISFLLIAVAVGVGILIINGSLLSKYDYFKKDRFGLDYGVEAAVKRRRAYLTETFGVKIAIGVGLCIVGILPVIIINAIKLDIEGLTFPITLIMISIGVNVLVRIGMENDSYKQILQEEEYSPDRKYFSKKISWFPPVYWLFVTAGYLAYSFIKTAWEESWIIWPVAGVAFPALYICVEAIMKRKNER